MSELDVPFKVKAGQIGVMSSKLCFRKVKLAFVSGRYLIRLDSLSAYWNVNCNMSYQGSKEQILPISASAKLYMNPYAETELKTPKLDWNIEVQNIAIELTKPQTFGPWLASLRAAAAQSGRHNLGGQMEVIMEILDALVAIDDIMTPEEKDKLFTAIGYSESSHNLALPKQYVAHIMTLRLVSTSVTLRENKNIPEILKIQIIGLGTQVSQRPGAQALKVEAKLEHWYITGLKQQGVVPSLVASIGDTTSSLLKIEFETNPENSTADQTLIVQSQPVEVIYDALNSKDQGLQKTNNSSLEEIMDKAYDKFDVEIKSVQLLFARAGSRKKPLHLISSSDKPGLDLLKVEYVKADKNGPSFQTTFEKTEQTLKNFLNNFQTAKEALSAATAQAAEKAARISSSTSEDDVFDLKVIAELNAFNIFVCDQKCNIADIRIRDDSVRPNMTLKAKITDPEVVFVASLTKADAPALTASFQCNLSLSTSKLEQMMEASISPIILNTVMTIMAAMSPKTKEDESKDTSKETENLWGVKPIKMMSIDLSVHVKRIGSRMVLSVFSPYWLINKTSRVLQYRSEDIHVDSQLPGTVFPVVFHPVAPPKSIALDSEPKPFIDVSVITRFNEYSKVLQFKLAYYELRYQFYKRDQLMWSVVRHYSEQGAVQGPEEFAEGLVIGVRSLFGHTVGGAAGVVSRITGSVGKGLAAITMDKEYQQKRREEMGRQPKDFGDSLARGGKGFLRGVVGGMTGIITKPVEGAKKEGAAGFFKGIGKGLVGAVARPTGGIIDMASSTFQGIQRAAESTEEVSRLRPPRFIHEDGIIRPYERQESEGYDLFENHIKKLEGETYRYHCAISGSKKTILMVTNRRVLCISEVEILGHMSIDWQCPFEDFVLPPSVHGNLLKISVKERGLFHKKDSASHDCRNIYLQDTTTAELLRRRDSDLTSVDLSLFERAGPGLDAQTRKFPEPGEPCAKPIKEGSLPILGPGDSGGLLQRLRRSLGPVWGSGFPQEVTLQLPGEGGDCESPTLQDWDFRNPIARPLQTHMSFWEHQTGIFETRSPENPEQMFSLKKAGSASQSPWASLPLASAAPALALL
ncbi:hypothetical protein GH733_004400 [Mirounga leonina]|nr:hypothetical protein GH733_004400 [Mirounga leonina]